MGWNVSGQRKKSGWYYDWLWSKATGIDHSGFVGFRKIGIVASEIFGK
jgi:hypothetical protein